MRPQGRFSLQPATKTSVRTKIAVYGSSIAVVMALAVVAVKLIPGDLSGRLPGFEWRKAITVDTSRVAQQTILNDFVLYVELQDQDLKQTQHGGKVHSPVGADIRFTDGEGALVLPQQLEHYNGKKGELKARVRVPVLRQDEPTTLYMYYGNENPESTMYGHSFSEVSLELPDDPGQTDPARWAVIQENRMMPDSFLIVSPADSVAAPLAAHFDHYKATVKGGSLVMVEWATNEEYENKKFIIERSYDGTTFEELGKTSGSGTSQEILRYSYADHKLPEGSTQYRLKQISRDYTFSYAAITQLSHHAGASKLEIKQVSPNPFQETFEVTFNSGSKAPVKLTFYDQDGNTLHEETIQANAGDNAWQYPYAKDLPKGVYVLTLIGENKKLKTQLITKE